MVAARRRCRSRSPGSKRVLRLAAAETVKRPDIAAASNRRMPHQGNKAQPAVAIAARASDIA
jgi:hypothetical protein